MPRWCATLLIGLGMLATARDTRAQEAPRPAGDWEGTLKLPVGELRLVIHVKAGPDGALSGTFDSPDLGVNGTVLDSVTLADRTLKFEHKKVRGRFEGQFNAAGTEIVGKWSQGASLPLTLRRVDPAAAAAAKVVAPAELKGLWSGTLNLPTGIELAPVLNVAPDAAGDLVPKLDSPDQQVKGISISALDFQDDRLSFAARTIGARYEGRRTADGRSFEGTFNQGLVKAPLTLTRVETAPERKRPQTPKAPFPYETDEVTFANPAAEGVTLAGTLSRPRGDGPFPVVVFISGSGRQDRDETILGHKPFAVIADMLARRGIASLRFDDRGTAKSTGDHGKATSQDFATDVRAAVEFLKTRPAIDPKRIGLIGHSEGGLIAPIVAADCPDVAFVVLLAGTGVPGDEILYRQNGLIAKAMGASDLAVAAQVSALKLSLAVVQAVSDTAERARRIKAIEKEAQAALPEADRKAIEAAEADGDPAEREKAKDSQVGQALQQLGSPWMKAFIAYDPRPTLERVKCPVLVLNGAKDLQVDPEQNVPEIEKALKAGGNTAVTVQVFPGLNHLFQTCTTGAPSEYAKIEETMAPEVLKAIGDWVVEQAGTK